VREAHLSASRIAAVRGGRFPFADSGVAKRSLAGQKLRISFQMRIFRAGRCRHGRRSERGRCRARRLDAIRYHGVSDRRVQALHPAKKTAFIDRAEDRIS
jgi:hypothetical protein